MKQNKTTTKTKISHLVPLSFQHLFICPCGIRGCHVSQSIYTLLPNQSYLQNIHCNGSRLLTHYHYHWTLTQSPLRYPDVALSQGDPAVIVLQDQSLHTLQQVIDADRC